MRYKNKCRNFLTNLRILFSSGKPELSQRLSAVNYIVIQIC